MAKEHINAGTKVEPGIYRCNACANRFECPDEGDCLPQCKCGSFSWRSTQLKKVTG